MSTLSVNGARVSFGTLTIPYYGTWTADITLPTDTMITSPATLVVGDLTLVGTVVRQAAFNGDLTARIVGGANGWGTTLPAKGYSHIIGVKLSTVLEDVARLGGETIEVDADRNLGTLFAREEGKAETLLSLLLDGHWWMSPEGVTKTGPRSVDPVVNPFTVVSYSGARGEFEIATEAMSQWQPGRTFSANTVPTVQTISSVSFEATNEGKLRLRVLSTDASSSNRLIDSLRAIIRSEMSAVLYAATWEYSIAANPLALGLTSTIDCTPIDPRMPSLTNVPLAGMGVVAPPIMGTKCRIRFVNADPSRPECISLGGTTEHLMTVEATALLIYNTLSTLMLAAGGGPLLAVVLQPLLGAAITGALTAQAVPGPPGTVAQTAAAVALQAGFATGVTPSPAMFAAWAAPIIALDTKSLNVSGLFPSIGVPNGTQ